MEPSSVIQGLNAGLKAAQEARRSEVQKMDTPPLLEEFPYGATVEEPRKQVSQKIKGLF